MHRYYSEFDDIHNFVMHFNWWSVTCYTKFLKMNESHYKMLTIIYLRIIYIYIYIYILGVARYTVVTFRYIPWFVGRYDFGTTGKNK